MNVAPINCTPIKPQVSFGKNISNQYGNDSEYERVVVLTDKVNSDVISSKEVKKPVAAVASVALAGLVAFVSGKKIAAIGSQVLKKLPTGFESALQKGSSVAKKFSENLIEKEGGKLAKVQNLAGKAIKGAEELAKKGYKKIAYSGIPEGTPVADRAAKAFQNVAGWAAVGATLPGVLKKDADGNGVADIMEKSTNVYDGTKSRCDSAIRSASGIADLIQELT